MTNCKNKKILSLGSVELVERQMLQVNWPATDKSEKLEYADGFNDIVAGILYGFFFHSELQWAQRSKWLYWQNQSEGAAYKPDCPQSRQHIFFFWMLLEVLF